MIKNVIFDFGKVLVDFDPYYMTSVYVKAEADILLLKDVLFDRLYWDKLDAGTITDEQVLNEVKKRIPESLWKQAEEVYYNWIYNLPEIGGMEDIVAELKQHGKKLCVLSNISKYFAEHVKEIPILRHFDSFVFSSLCGYVKPQREIFDHAVNKFGLKKEETLFVDDCPDNVKGAREAGLLAYHFDGDSQKLLKYLKEAVF